MLAWSFDEFLSRHLGSGTFYGTDCMLRAHPCACLCTCEALQRVPVVHAEFCAGIPALAQGRKSKRARNARLGASLPAIPRYLDGTLQMSSLTLTRSRLRERPGAVAAEELQADDGDMDVGAAGEIRRKHF